MTRTRLAEHYRGKANNVYGGLLQMIARPPRDWKVPWRTCLIATVQRSGSNFLSDLMRQTEKLGAPEEFFNLPKVAAHYPGRGETIVDCCLLAREEGMTENGVLSIKLFRKHFRRLQSGVRLTEWFGEPQWIWLRRRDVLAQAISWSIALQTKMWRFPTKPPSIRTHSASYVQPIAATKTPQYSADDIETRLFTLLAHNAEWEAFFVRTKLEPLCFWYEDVEVDPGGTVVAIGSFLRVKVTDASLTSGRLVTRQRTALNEEWRERFHKDVGSIDHVSKVKARIRVNASSGESRLRRLLMGLLSRPFR